MDELIEKVKRKLKITWDDVDTNTRVKEIVENAVHTLNFKLGIPHHMQENSVYTSPGQEQNLIINYCMYEWNNNVSKFDSNYKNEIMQLQAKYEVEAYKHG